MLAMRTVCFWPGLPSAWVMGRTRGLLVALIFSWSVCLLLLATFIWPDWVASGLLRTLWGAAIVAWLIASILNFLRWPGMLAVSDAECAQAFVDAQREYLRGHWFEAEAMLLEVLNRHPRDAEAMLLLVGVMRHTKRFRPALRRLGQLGLMESAAAWRFEIGKEREIIQRAMAEEVEAEEVNQVEAQTPEEKVPEEKAIVAADVD